jgi:hypothetical protein
MSAEARVAARTSNNSVALTRLEADGWIERHGQAFRTSRPWQRAMARAAAKLYEAGDPGDDLRVPIALALFESYQHEIEDEVLADFVEAILPIEAESLGLIRN